MASSHAVEDVENNGVPYNLNNLVLREVTEAESTEIGRGAYGRVFKVLVQTEVRNHTEKKLCAAKEVHPALMASIDEDQQERIRTMFYRECDCHSQLNHPNVVKMIGLYPNQSSLPWLVMELMDTNLTKYLEDNACDKVSSETKASIIIDISEGLKYLHNMNIVHRDLSSNNILLMVGLVKAKIADFGVAKVMSNHSKLTSQTMNRGTEHFMPPEVFSEHAHYGKPVDVFSLACVILHIMSHQWPKPKHATEYVDEELIALTEDKRRADYLKFCNPPPLQKLAVLCLHNKPTERPEVSDLWHKLKEILSHPPMPTASDCVQNGTSPSCYHRKQNRAVKSLCMRIVMEKQGTLCKSRPNALSEDGFPENLLDSTENLSDSTENLSDSTENISENLPDITENLPDSTESSEEDSNSSDEDQEVCFTIIQCSLIYENFLFPQTTLFCLLCDTISCIYTAQAHSSAKDIFPAPIIFVHW